MRTRPVQENPNTHLSCIVADIAHPGPLHPIVNATEGVGQNLFSFIQFLELECPNTRSRTVSTLCHLQTNSRSSSSATTKLFLDRLTPFQVDWRVICLSPYAVGEMRRRITVSIKQLDIDRPSRLSKVVASFNHSPQYFSTHFQLHFCVKGDGISARDEAVFTTGSGKLFALVHHTYDDPCSVNLIIFDGADSRIVLQDILSEMEMTDSNCSWIHHAAASIVPSSNSARMVKAELLPV